ATMQALAQEHANDMARRGSMEHKGFARRARRGARAENVAYGVKTKQQAIALWWGSSGHAANMRLSGCKAVASAVGHNGTRYWAMVIGNWGSCREGADECPLSDNSGQSLILARDGLSANDPKRTSRLLRDR